VSETTKIAWTEKTWNPWQGCHRVSPGCANCYMYAEKNRYGQDPSTVVRSKPPTFNAPRKWAEPALVFTCSWSDFFIEDADAWRAEAWEIIRATPHLTYQILTKRPERIASCLPADWGEGWPNVWLGTTVENAAARSRLLALTSVPAALYFASIEPLISDVGNLGLGCADHVGNIPLDWVIVGGESGQRARPCDVEWIRSIVAQCQAAGVPVFVKQLGANSGRVDEDGHQWLVQHLRDRKGGDPSEWPEDLRIREFPEVSR
jgi:protein gp37